ncbi:3-deoxy-7-phosphoheptulonate synthase AroG [Oligella urethralis]|uniref:3-deoxy-7-phosphoheptulonate synthase AroG n=1 Tax=Oligella urethralis TaxID=90245 RepID=UPI0027BA2AC9|nr:3-deoxy-7-phosphoheptulonate synthase AroG [Oligella urethralis]
MSYNTDDLRIDEIRELTPPSHLMREFPCTPDIAGVVHESRQAIHNILHDQDDRLVVVVGPCSIHDPKAALEYADLLKVARDKYAGELEVVMRVYFEKPRTTVGWKGLINDPDLDASFNINKGLRIGRQLLLDINAKGLPAGCEFLDMISPQYMADLVSWGAIGARTTESQVHRELSSGLSCPVGFKNGTDGNVKIAVDAVQAASRPHSFLSVTKGGHSAIVRTRGNDDCHIILRGGNDGPNYSAAHIQAASEVIEKAGLKPKIMIDASHANSSKKPENQPIVMDDVAQQLEAGNQRICGVMIESHLVAGRQDQVEGKPLVYGQSITDGCIDWETTERVLARLAEAVKVRRQKAA